MTTSPRPGGHAVSWPPVAIHNRHGERLDFTLHQGAAGRNDLVVIGHGVTANKDRPWLVVLAERLAATGVAALRFSFSGNGSSGGAFAESTISKEVDDLGAVLDACSGRRIAYAGHSMGGAVGVIRASRDPRIRALISLAGMVATRAFAARKFGALVPGRSCMWDKPECPLSQAFVDDMNDLDSVVELGAQITVPWLLVHGTNDTVVPLQDSIDIHARAAGPAELRRIDGADHVFAGGATARMVSEVVAWLDGGEQPGE